MPKVALITFHNSLNYGALCQTYATCKILKRFAAEVILIDIRIEENYSLLQKCMGLWRNFKLWRFRRIFFPQKTKYYKTIEALKKCPPLADIYLVGSDQTWNHDITKSLTEAFYLDFGDISIPRIGFSVSFGKDNWYNVDGGHKEYVRKQLELFKSLSVRESSGVLICKEELNVKASHTLDPTLLVDDFKELTGQITPSNNIVSYKFIGDDDYYQCLKNIGLNLDKDIILLGKMKPVKGFKYYYPQSVKIWIKKIASADLVFTDSFHGITMSIIYQRNFIAFVGDPQRLGRITSLLSSLGLEDRLYLQENYNHEKIIEMSLKPINYKFVQNKLNDLRQFSLDFLQNALCDKFKTM